jgi:transcription elongation factor Elf1
MEKNVGKKQKRVFRCLYCNDTLLLDSTVYDESGNVVGEVMLCVKCDKAFLISYLETGEEIVELEGPYAL